MFKSEEPTVELELTLNMCQKLLQRLKELSKEYGALKSSTGRRGIVPRTTLVISTELGLKNIANVSSDSVVFAQKVEKAKTEKRNSILQKFILLEDIRAVKDAIFEGNTKFGLDKVLSQIELINCKIDFLKEQRSKVSSSVSDEDLDAVYANKDTSNSDPYSDTPSYNYLVFSRQEIDTEFKKLQKQLLELIQKRDTINLKKVKLSINNNNASLAGFA